MELKELFNVVYTNGQKELASQDDIDFKVRYWQFKVLEKFSVGKLWPKNATVKKIGSNRSNCYVDATYEIVADSPLTENDMTVIRCQYDFLSGQETAKCNLSLFQIVDKKYVYIATSICDSSD